MNSEYAERVASQSVAKGLEFVGKPDVSREDEAAPLNIIPDSVTPVNELPVFENSSSSPSPSDFLAPENAFGFQISRGNDSMGEEPPVVDPVTGVIGAR